MAFGAKKAFFVVGSVLLCSGGLEVHAANDEPQKKAAAAQENSTRAEPDSAATESIHLSEIKPAEAGPAPRPTERSQPSESPLVAVLDLRHESADAALANALAAVITSEVANREGLRAVSRNELSAVLNHQAEQALLGCDSVKCAADVAKLVEADLVITGGIERAGEAYVLTLTLIDPTIPEAKARTEAVWRSSPEEMVLLAKPYVERLFGGEVAATYKGALEVLAPDGANVFVDSRDLGQAPLKSAVTDLSIGVHTVEVSQSGYYTALRDVVITRGETSVARVELEAQPIWTQWWFWTAVGGAAVTATGAGTMFGLWYLNTPKIASVSLGK